MLSVYLAAIFFLSCHTLTSVEICLFHLDYLSMLSLDFEVGLRFFFCMHFGVNIRDSLQNIEQVPSIVSFLSSVLLR